METLKNDSEIPEKEVFDDTSIPQTDEIAKESNYLQLAGLPFENIELAEEEMYEELFLESEPGDKLPIKTGLETEEMIKNSWPLDKVKNFTKGQEVISKDGSINLSALSIIHATNFPAVKDGNNLYIESSGNADPKHDNISKWNENYEHLAGLLNSRFTIHFGMPGYVASHESRKKDGTINEEDLLPKRRVVYIVSLDKAVAKNTVCNINASDTFFWDRFEIPEGSIIIINDKAAQQFELSKKDFEKY